MDIVFTIKIMKWFIFFFFDKFNRPNSILIGAYSMCQIQYINSITICHDKWNKFRII